MRSRIDLADLQLFVHIAEALSLTRAAEQSGMSLASASNRVRQLEEQLGAKLLSLRRYKTCKRTALTEGDMVFLKRICKVD
ncbi:MAG: LysR family transcriptional regulator, partial [Betaproteobacteria bacterium]|nr:LysR family transcriptional regulator [Betaproteobacteria bacterium]